MRLNNKLAVVTAAASGMGRAGVELALNEGAKVVAIDINADGLAELKADMKANGHDLHIIQADLSSRNEIRSSINQAADHLGGIDILWSHAGIPGPSAIEDLDDAAYDKCFAVNIDSAVFGAGEVIKHMRKRGGGAIVFTSSISGMVGSMFSPVYSVAKFGIIGLTKSLAQTFAPDGVRVNAVCPGLIDTPMAEQFISRGGDPIEAAANEKKLMSRVPLGRRGKASEIAEAAIWLASDAASFVTGAALPVDGGFTCK